MVSSSGFLASGLTRPVDRGRSCASSPTFWVAILPVVASSRWGVRVRCASSSSCRIAAAILLRPSGWSAHSCRRDASKENNHFAIGALARIAVLNRRALSREGRLTPGARDLNGVIRIFNSSCRANQSVIAVKARDVGRKSNSPQKDNCRRWKRYRRMRTGSRPRSWNLCRRSHVPSRANHPRRHK